MTKTYIVAAKRTAIGKFLGTTLSMTAADLGAAVIKKHYRGNRSQSRQY